MPLTRKTVVLLVVAVLLLGLNLLDRQGPAPVDDLPTLPAIDRDQVERIEVSTALGKVVIEQVEEEAGGEHARSWYVSSPYEAEADDVAIKALLRNFRKPVRVDARVDSGDYDRYGLQPGHGVLFEVWLEGQEEPALSFTVGDDAPGGATFIRITGDDSVYRAHVGGRHRYDKRAAEWRNRLLLRFDPEDVAEMRVEQGGRTTLHVARGPSEELDEDGEPVPGPWRFVEPEALADADADQRALDALAKTMGHLRAGELLGEDFDGGFDAPRAVFEATLANGAVRRLVVGTRQEEHAAFVRAGGRAWRVSSAAIDRMLRPAEEFRDRTLLSFNRKDVDTLRYREGDALVLLQQDLSTGLWEVLRPKDVDIDVKDIFFCVNNLADLRAHELAEVSPEEAGLRPPRATVEVRLLDGTVRELRFGRTLRDRHGHEAVYVQADDRPERVFVLLDRVAEKILHGFGRPWWGVE